ncbi:MAG: class I SAM-dependent methyltransferase [Verrucomicrobia bacterium]|nr:MAG: class I SAM-dependent methyltransferase [Verrucomicrobiota bacterium]
MITREEVIWCYRTILGRIPESEEVIAGKMKLENFDQLRKIFLDSKEFKSKFNIQERNTYLPLTLPKNNILMGCSEEELQACIRKIKEAWTHLGIIGPHFSVLTNKNFLPENLNNYEEDFWKSGEGEASHLETILKNYSLEDLSSKKIVEYGCGVGRVTMGLASLFAQVDAYDISEGHLEIAKQKAVEKGYSQCHFHLCSDDLLEPLEKCHCFYSRIVLQHNPPPLIRHLIKMALASLLPGGIAIFQVPTYIKDYSFNTKEWIAKDHPLDMQMHALPQSLIFSLIADAQCQLLEVREDGSTGDPARYLSNTFIIKK